MSLKAEPAKGQVVFRRECASCHRLDREGSAVGPDLFAGAQQAIRYMIDHLATERGLSREEAYILCSVAVDLKISEIVDAPNWIVSAFLPESIFV